jgi:hypothetical protein
MTTSAALEIFLRRDLGEAELRKAAELLGPVTENACFWSAIANDAWMPAAHRRLSLVALVRRHVIAGTTRVGALVEMLDGARWLGDGDITMITAIGGKIPITWSSDDTLVAIALPGGGAIYLAIAGQLTAEEITAALHGMSREERVLSAVIQDAGIEAGG